MREEYKYLRRRFLKIAGGTLLTGAVIGGGFLSCTRQPYIEMPETSYQGAREMKNNILVAYASKCGSTAEVADVIGQVLHNQGTSVDVRSIDKVTDISAYEALIVGSAIRMGQCLSAAKKFVQAHQQALQGKPLAYFAVCLSLHENTEEKRREAEHYLDALQEIVKPRSKAAFAGNMDFSTLSLLDRTIAKMVKSPQGDFRNWEAIRAWAESLTTMLT